MNRPLRRAAVQTGFTMMEVLISMMILAVGILGLAATQLHALKASRAALYQSMATVLALDMAHRIRANGAAALNGAYHMGCWTDQAGCTAAVTDCRAAAGCSAADMAQDDLDQWRQWLDGSHPDTHNGLPGGAGRICVSSTADINHCDNAPDPNGRRWHLIQVSWLQADHPASCSAYHTPDNAATDADDRPCFLYKLPVDGQEGWHGAS